MNVPSRCWCMVVATLVALLFHPVLASLFADDERGHPIEDFDWSKFPHTKDFSVPAVCGESDPIRVAHVSKGDEVTLYIGDVHWTGGGTKTGKYTGWRGYPDRYEHNHLPWMALVAKVGDRTFLPDKKEFTFTVPDDGVLALFCNDDNPDGNRGRGLVKVKIEQSRRAD